MARTVPDRSWPESLALSVMVAWSCRSVMLKHESGASPLSSEGCSLPPA